MHTPEDVAKRFYECLAGTNGQALFDLLTDDFVGTVSAGMPHGVGGEHRGRTAMLSDVWGPIASIYDMHVDPEEFLVVDDTRVVVLGRYWGPARDGNRCVDAAFAHVITTREDRIAALQQITDTARWELPSPRAS
ncbi:nuclear transport factor 2 family protein [Mycobacterium deserti]|uniref:Nuclear transport factor 2 family protein n=1 Tax=Mycobacterium deserti TaxID=2978347 RepID=A0ABT2MER6_9MYCO|nr:nuclear transport factor 2 family protein [Mycobacterium deserti]MCT7660770.1 nuclear transport factor 2 family protein [Mycobacterium deserti]